MAKQLKTMSIDQLAKMRDEVDAAIAERAAGLRKKLTSLSNGGGFAVGNPRKAARAAVAPMYRHPKTGETWSGRGRMANWLAAEIKDGKKKEAFLVEKRKA